MTSVCSKEHPSQEDPADWNRTQSSQEELPVTTNYNKITCYTAVELVCINFFYLNMAFVPRVPDSKRGLKFVTHRLHQEKQLYIFCWIFLVNYYTCKIVYPPVNVSPGLYIV